MNNFALASFTLLKREIVRFLRQRHRIVGAFGTPLVFWVLIGSGLGKSFRSPTGFITTGGPANYLQYFFPGTVALILLFTAIFSTISIIEDRREGFLQGVLVSPVSRGAVVMGKILGGTALAVGQGLLFLLVVPFMGIHMRFIDVVYVITVMTTLSFGLTGLGFLIAWKLDSTQGFHAIMNLFLMPMWFLSGALFPMEGAPAWLQFVMRLNPLTYGVSGLHQGFFHDALQFSYNVPSMTYCLAVTVLFSGAVFLASAAIARKTE